MPAAIRTLLSSATPFRSAAKLAARLRRCRLFLSLGAIALLPAGAGAEFTVAPAVSPAATASSAIDAPAALQGYTARAAELRRRALARETVDYDEVVAAAYPAGVIDTAVVQSKAAWRAAQGEDFMFISDYAEQRHRARVRELTAVPDPELHSTLVAQYESVNDTIGISTRAADVAIFHEAGHALQRSALRWRSGAAGRRIPDRAGFLERLLRAGTADATTAHRLVYLCSQDEFEVRLQDLNRFCALLVTGRPIMDAGDSIRALTALGLPLDYDEAQQALASGGLALTPAEFAALVVPPPADASGEVAAVFEDARELLMLRRLALSVDRSCWERMLAKIIFEAPGHL